MLDIDFLELRYVGWLLVDDSFPFEVKGTDGYEYQTKHDLPSQNEVPSKIEVPIAQRHYRKTEVHF